MRQFRVLNGLGGHRVTFVKVSMGSCQAASSVPMRKGLFRDRASRLVLHMFLPGFNRTFRYWQMDI